MDPIGRAEAEENLAEAREIKAAAKRQYDEALALESKIEGELVEDD